MRILHTADWHLSQRGNIAGRYILKDGINLMLVDRILAINQICEYAEENDIDLTIISGDIFDHNNPDDISRKVAIEAIERLSEQAPVIITRGNHDGQKGNERASALAVFGSFIRRFGVYVSERPETVSFLIRSQRVNVFTLPYPRRAALKSDPSIKSMSPEEISVFIGRKMEEILSGFQAQIERDAVNILSGHFTVSGSIYSKEQNVPPFDISVRKEFLDKFGLVCLGHLHQVQPFYSGAIARDGFGEESMQPGFKVYDIHDGPARLRQPGEKVEEQFISLPARQYLTIPVEDFLNNSSHPTPEMVVRIKGKLTKPLYDEAVRKMRILDLPFLKNAIEVETETAGSSEASEEPDLEEAIRMWGKGREGVDKFMDRLISAAKEIEARAMES